MASQRYYVDCDDMGYCVKSNEETIVVFALIEDAYAALQEFQSKSFPDNWDKIPPAMRLAKQRFYGG